MIRRLYFHPSVILEGGRAYCAECGKELSPAQLPCEEPCVPGVVSVLYDATGRLLNVEIDPAAQDAVEALILHAVESQGAINISGIYSPPDELIPYLEAGKIRAKEA